MAWQDGLAGVHWSTDPSCATGSTDRSRDGSARPASSARCSTWKATPGSLLRAASSAATWGGLPGYCMAAPLARYALMVAALRRTPYARIYADEPPWARPFGIAQMALFTAATAPFGAAATRLAVRLAAPLVAPLQLVGMLLLHRRSHRTVGA